MMVKIKFTESKTAFRNINGVDVSDENWQKILRESTVMKCCEQVADHFKKSKIRAFRDPELKHEITNNPFVYLLNSKSPGIK